MTRAEYLRDAKRIRKDKLRKLLGGKCVLCGATDMLQFDHIDRKTKSFNIGMGITKSWDKLLVEITKCQLLCRTCHIEKTRSELWKGAGTFLHGTLGGYNNYRCRCELCRGAHSVYYKKKYKDRKI